MRAFSGIASLPLLVAGLVAIIIAGAAGIFIYTNQQDENVEPEATPSITTPAEPTAVVETAIAEPTPAPTKVTPSPQPSPAQPIAVSGDRWNNWKTYHNAQQKVSFRYPPDFTVDHDGAWKPEFPDWHRVGLHSFTRPGRPVFILEVNSDKSFGFNASNSLPDKLYTVADDGKQGIKIVSVKEFAQKSMAEGIGSDVIVADFLKHSNGNTYYWWFYFGSDNDSEALWRDILESFHFDL